MAARNKRRLISCLFILAVLLRPSHGAAVEPTPFDLAYAEWQERHGLCGGLLASTWDGKAIRTVAFGNTPADSRIVIASLSKAAILALIDDGKLHLDQTAGELLQQYFERLGQPADADVKTLTVRQLLEHRSGARFGRSDPAGWVNFRAAQSKHGHRLTDRELLAAVLKGADLVPSAGTTFTYSNFNYLVLGVIVAEIAGTTYEAYVKDRILGRVGLSAPDVDPVEKAAGAYATWRFTAAEYLSFFRVFERDNTAVFSPRAHVLFDEAAKAAPGRYTFGLNFHGDPADGAIWHTGTWGGPRTIVQRTPYGLSWILVYPKPANSKAVDADRSQIRSTLITAVRHMPRESASTLVHANRPRC